MVGVSPSLDQFVHALGARCCSVTVVCVLAYTFYVIMLIMHHVTHLDDHWFAY